LEAWEEAEERGGRGGLQPPLQLLQPWISEVGDEEEEVEERRKWREGEEEEEISPPLIHFVDPPLLMLMLCKSSYARLTPEVLHIINEESNDT